MNNINNYSIILENTDEEEDMIFEEQEQEDMIFEDEPEEQEQEEEEEIIFDEDTQEEEENIFQENINEDMMFKENIEEPEEKQPQQEISVANIISNLINKKQNKHHYGFIMTRHVNSEKTNRYWNNNIRQLRKLYPFKRIVIIDDNSDPKYLKKNHNFDNILTIQSQYPSRGELLPYIYYNKYKWFDNAVIIHDSIFFQKRIPFEKVRKPVMHLWNFNGPPKQENIQNNLRIASVLKNYDIIKKQLTKTNSYWNGCFGVQSYINHSFLNHLMRKYAVNRLLHVVKNRTDRCSLERVMGVLFYLETKIKRSLLGSCFPLFELGLSFDDYIRAKKNNSIQKPVVKIFTGR